MSDWALAVSVLGALGGLGFLAQATLRQLFDRIDSESQRVMSHVDRRFEEAEARRREQTQLWNERLADRDRRIEELAARISTAHAEHPELREHIGALARRFDDYREHVASNYVSREVWLEHVGGISIKLDKLKTELDRLTTAGIKP